MTNVRSFDVKAYDNALAGYADLGWGDDLRLYVPYQNDSNFTSSGTRSAMAQSAHIWPVLPHRPHEQFGDRRLSSGRRRPCARGRMPPLSTTIGSTLSITRAGCRRSRMTFELRLPVWVRDLPRISPYNGNIGDDNAGVVRLRRVWDTLVDRLQQGAGTRAQHRQRQFPGRSGRTRRRFIRRIRRPTRRRCGGSRSRSVSPIPQINVLSH